MVECCGRKVVGPVGRLEQAPDLARRERIDVTVLDVQVNRETRPGSGRGVVVTTPARRVILANFWLGWGSRNLWRLFTKGRQGGHTCGRRIPYVTAVWNACPNTDQPILGNVVEGDDASATGLAPPLEARHSRSPYTEMRITVRKTSSGAARETASPLVGLSAHAPEP